MSVLVYLAAHPGELLSKEQILQAVWPDTFVSDHVLTNAISEIRKAFGDDPQLPHVIQTVPREGYRLVEEVVPLKTEGDSSGTRRTVWIWRAAAATSLAIVITLLVFHWVSSQRIDSVAVLVIDNKTGDKEHDALCFGMTERMAYRLRELPNLRVVNSLNAGSVEPSLIEAQSLGAEIGVRAILQGRLYQHGDNLALYLILLDTSDGSTLWGESFDFVLDDVGLVQEQIARRVTEKVSPRLGFAERPP
jgi:TolB-like protein